MSISYASDKQRLSLLVILSVVAERPGCCGHNLLCITSDDVDAGSQIDQHRGFSWNGRFAKKYLLP